MSNPDPLDPWAAEPPPGPVTDWIIEGVVRCPATCGLYLDFYGTPAELAQFTAAHDCARTAAQARYED